MFLAGPRFKNSLASKLALDFRPFDPGIMTFYRCHFAADFIKIAKMTITKCQTINKDTICLWIGIMNSQTFRKFRSIYNGKTKQKMVSIISAVLKSKNIASLFPAKYPSASWLTCRRWKALIWIKMRFKKSSPDSALSRI